MTSGREARPGRVGYRTAGLLALAGLLGLLLSTNPVTVDGDLRTLPGTRTDPVRRTLSVPSPGRYAVWSTRPGEAPASGACHVNHEPGAAVAVRTPELNIKWVEVGADGTIYTAMAEFTADTPGMYLITCAIPTTAHGPGLVVSVAPDVSGTLPARLREQRPLFVVLLLSGVLSAVAGALLRHRARRRSGVSGPPVGPPA